ncbi:putative RNA-binding Zn ribbon-like protein [Kibdelosporangium banguiense]|uniref:RNA-binding Zn ribbon-like protein n=1 Tax=Kibdelosporangium banguiense TaxID=1365924 RepID=A0ABS4TX83_9PSEU|nr:CGNR zinc finger domain-containing protein [Kibdelosporangium banguiense]MBP2329026.1 putative RNA-binding Zn ribbon-like protein [Kibdelosporangium banguiense]
MHDPAKQAPGTLELVRKFVNTDDIYNDRDELENEGAATAWLAKEGVLTDDWLITADDLVALHDLRDTLRALAAANATGEQAPHGVVDAFNRLSAPHAASVRLDVEHGSLVGFVRAHDGGAGGVIVALAAAVHQAVLTGTWTRLKSCANPECRWLYYDESRSRTARWCSMRACGSVTKARRYRERQRRQALDAS